MDNRTCSVCGYTGPSTDFTVTRRVNGKAHYNGRCKPCYNAYHKARRLERGDDWQKVRRTRDFKNKYGITLDEYHAMLEAQDNCCALCGVHKDTQRRWLNVDHCHTTGAVRGLLCDDCNVALGKFKDNTDVLLRAVAYLGN
jgi:hypothetical protein